MASKYNTPEDIRFDKQYKDLLRRVSALESSIGLSFSSVGRGGLVIKDGGGLTIKEGGSLSVFDSGNIQAIGVDGLRYAAFGPFSSFDPVTGEPITPGEGLLIQSAIEGSGTDPERQNDQADIFRALRFPSDNQHWVEVGELTAIGGDIPLDFTSVVGRPVDAFLATASYKQHVTLGDVLELIDGQWICQSSNTAWIIPDNSQVIITATNTTGSANTFIGGTNPGDFSFIQRITSSAAAKVDVEDFEVDSREVLQLQPRTWRDRGEVEEDAGTDRWHVGLIAEEVDAAGLTEFVDYDEDDKPNSVTYDRLTIALLAVIKEQNERISDLERRMAALDNETAPEVESKTQRDRKPKRKTTSIKAAPPSLRRVRNENRVAPVRRTQETRSSGNR